MEDEQAGIQEEQAGTQEDGKKSATFRLSAPARSLLTALAKRDGISKAAVLELSIREYARQKGLKVPGDAAPQA